MKTTAKPSNAPNYTHEVCIPFSGFYETIHGSHIDDEVTALVTDTNGDVYDDLYNKLDSCRLPYSAMRSQYAKRYTELASHELTKIDGLGSATLKFTQLQSPREYNFSTDRIFAHLTTRGVGALYKYVIDNCLIDLRCKVRDQFTHRDGFISYYDADYTTWGAPIEWDHNQLGVLLEVAIDHAYERGSQSGCEAFGDDLVEGMRQVTHEIVAERLRTEDYDDKEKVLDILYVADQRLDEETYY